MTDIKLSLSIILPGGVMYSQQEALKKLRKPVRNKKGKIVKKQGKAVLCDVWVPDFAKNDVTEMTLRTSSEENPNVPQDTKLTVYTRKSKPAKQVINMTQEAYDNMLSKEAPYNYRGEFGLWKTLSKNQKIKWHCMQIAKSVGGEFDSFQVLD